MSVATMTSKGQITLPKAIRDRYLLKTGDKIEFRVTDNGEVRLLPRKKKPIEVLGLLAGKAGVSLTVEAMHESIRGRFR